MKLALLIGAPVMGLEAPRSDVARVERCLALLGFHATIVCEGAATRVAIWDAFETLIARAGAKDQVVIYYSGHGGLAPNPAYQASARGADWQPPHFQFLVPVDIGASSEGDFRGILDLELAVLLERLTLQTQNVVVILDCCHASGTMRQAGFRAKSLVRPWDRGIAAQFAGLRQNGVDGRRSLDGNPHAVRLLACGTHELAYEYDPPGVGPSSIFTEALTQVLLRDGWQALSWHQLMQQVRERVQLKRPCQRPCVEGPAQRRVFAEGLCSGPSAFPVFCHVKLLQREARIRGGHLHGVSPGDVLALHAETDPEGLTNHLGRIRVEHVTAEWSRVTALEGGPLRPGLWAKPLQQGLRKMAVRLRDVPAVVRKQWTSSEALTFEADDDAALLGEVRCEQGLYRLLTASGIEAETGDAQLVLSLLERMVKAKRLLGLCSGTEAEQLTQPFRVDWGRVEDGTPCSLPPSQAVFHVDDALYVQVDNLSQAPLYLHVFDVNLDYEIQLLTWAEPAGVTVAPATTRFLGFDPRNGHSNWRLSWSPRLPQGGEARPEHLVVILCGGPVDLSGLQSCVRGQNSRAMLRGRLAQIVHARARAIEDSCDATPFAVVHLDLLLRPRCC